MMKKFLETIKNQYREDWCVNTTIVIAMVAYGAAAPLLWEWLKSSYIGKGMRWLFNNQPEYLLLFFLLNALIVAATWYIGWRWYKDKDRRWYRSLLLLFGFQILHCQNELKSPEEIGGFSYKCFFTILLVGLGITLALKHLLAWRRQKKRQTTADNGNNGIRLDQNLEVGFTVDDTDIAKATKEQRDYARSIVDHLMKTDLHEHSFAIGITGEWGEGKSLFLEVIEDELKGRAEVVRFNPWMCRTPEQLTDDFFVALRQQLSKNHSTLSRPISDYARYVNNATFNVDGGLWTRVTLNMPHESLQVKKMNLSERFIALKQPVVVIIDDIDRLDEEEVYEVLRLIRNTADLCNVIYVVAYDKEYVTAVLSKKKIKDGTTYLEKIFNVEAHQPKVEVHQLEKVMREELANFPTQGERFANMIFNRIDQPSKKMLFEILNNYRRVKRFSRLYLLNVDYLISIYSKEIKLMDLFWMELLQTYDMKVYKTLFDEPFRYLYIEDEQYHLRPGIYKEGYYGKKEQSQAYKGDDNWHSNTPHLLHNLFESNTSVSLLSMRHVENYKKYFTLGVSKFNLSVEEIKALFDSQQKPEEVVMGWINGGKYITSIMFQLEHTDMARLTDDNVRRYIVALMELGCCDMFYQWRLKFRMKQLLTLSRYNNAQQSVARGYFLQWCYDKAKDSKHIVPLSRLLKYLYIPQSHDEDGRELEKKQCIYTDGDIEMLLNDIMRGYLNNHLELKATAILQEKSEIGKLFGNCCVMESDGATTDEYDSWKNVVFETVIKHFAGKNEKPTMTDYDAAYGRMFMEHRTDEELDDYDYQNFLMEMFENATEAYFGSRYEDQKRFKEECFIEDHQV